MLYWNSGPIWFVSGSRKWKALRPYGFSKIKFVDRLVASIFPSQDGCVSDITCLWHSLLPPINLISTQDRQSRPLEAPSGWAQSLRQEQGLLRVCLWLEGRSGVTQWKHSHDAPPPPSPCSPHPGQKLPDTRQAGALGKRRTKKDSKWNAGYFLRQYVGQSSKTPITVEKKEHCWWKRTERLRKQGLSLSLWQCNITDAISQSDEQSTFLSDGLVQ